MVEKKIKIVFNDCFSYLYYFSSYKTLSVIKITSNNFQNKTIIAAGDDGILRIYDQYEGDLLYTLVAHNTNSSINKIVIAQDKLIAIFSDR